MIFIVELVTGVNEGNDISTPLQPISDISQTVPESDECVTNEPGHSRNSSNTSQMSKASGYSSINSQSQHSRQSSSGDSGHIR